MKRFLSIAILSFFLMGTLKANDIQDFQIDGMGIGDSLLNFFSKNEITNAVQTNYPGSDKFYGVHFLSKSSNYDQYSFMIKSNDNKYKSKTVKRDINKIINRKPSQGK